MATIRLPLATDLDLTVKKFLREQWSSCEGRIVPEPSSLNLSNDCVNLDATVLYADIAGSTKLVDDYKPHFASEVYKCYLACAAKIVKDQGGVITAYDGDRIMAVYIGDTKNFNATKTAFRINGAVYDIINPAIKLQYPNTNFALRHVIGIDTSKLMVSRIGVRNDNDLVWVGRAANYAAKLSSIGSGNTLWITEDVFNRLHDDVKFGGNPKQLMWERRLWTDMNNLSIYRSTWKFGV
jgi:class 3 adenylate cyclase